VGVESEGACDFVGKSTVMSLQREPLVQRNGRIARFQ
jgi:hypothetical protein